jgi:hypothetical protein
MRAIRLNDSRPTTAGKGAKYTASRLPVDLVYSEPCESLSVALKREIEIKRWTASEEGSTPQAVRASLAPPRSRPADHPKIDKGGEHHDGQRHPGDRSAAVDRPGIGQRRQRHEQEPDERPQILS